MLHAPSPSSLNFRSNLRSLVSPLKRIRPKVPFWRLPAHRIPTLWGLYRGLLRSAPTENIHLRIKELFKKNHHLTGTQRTIQGLRKGYKWLDTFRIAQSGDLKTQALLQRYDRFLALRTETEHWKQLALKEAEWQRQMKNRPILTGGYIHATPFNPPLPRMKPQPKVISQIMVKRIKQRTRRFAKMDELKELKNMIRTEQQIEQTFMREAVDMGASFNPIYHGHPAWVAPISDAARTVYNNVLATTTRNLRPVSEELREQVVAARRNKIANKTRERQRERRGEILKRTRKRWRKNLTPHLLSTLSKKQIEEELIVQRSIAEVGYVGLLKKRKGWKLKEPTPKVAGKVWSVEDAEWIGKEEREAAANALRTIQEKNQERGATWEENVPS